MRITIEFDSCWQTGFLGDDPKKKFDLKNNAATYSKGDFEGKTKKNFHESSGYEQKFVATSGTRGEKPTPISKSTILGVLCRLIGDQRPLWKARQSSNYYFSDIEDRILEPIIERDAQEVSELVYLTNKSDARCAQQGYLGVLNDDNPWFFSEEAKHLWSVLYLNKEQLIQFVENGKPNEPLENSDLCKPTALINRINLISDSKSELGALIRTNERLQRDQILDISKKASLLSDHNDKIKLKPSKTKAHKLKNDQKLTQLTNELSEAKSYLDQLKIDSLSEFETTLNSVTQFLSDKYPNDKKRGEEYCKDGLIYPMSLYAAALHLQAERLSEMGLDLLFAYNSKQEIQIQGFSKAGFNGIRDWLNRMAGGRKKAVGTPCNIQKHSGRLEIEIGLNNDDYGREFPELTRSQEIIKLIEHAGVSSFYLGKKGLAYVSKIRS
ncbi:type I-Fv CRISPR-associated protein Cas5fv [Marinomonas sp. THO17]|uniref:type I-Fv CRISPR-associated protein Cas5fv n=1 Tax=Marinomonas sp. THO17 TaxID=3149048 RepID=UPI00336BF121